MGVTKEEFLDKVEIVVVPDGREEGDRGYDPYAKFCVYTQGLERFGRPELEFIDVPALWLSEAHVALCTLGLRSIKTPLPTDQGVIWPDVYVIHLFDVTPSEQKHWKKGQEAMTVKLRTVYDCSNLENYVAPTVH